MRSVTLSAKARGLSPEEIEKVRAVLRNPELAARLEHIVSRDYREATEIVERAVKYASILKSNEIRFKANDNKDYFIQVDNKNPGSVYNSLAYEVFNTLYPHIEPNEEELCGLTDSEYLKYINASKKLWQEDIE
jgi:hypothetical protein